MGKVQSGLILEFLDCLTNLLLIPFNTQDPFEGEMDYFMLSGIREWVREMTLVSTATKLWYGILMYHH